MNWDEYFYYDETSPTCLRWKVDIYAREDHKSPRVNSGDVAGCFTSRNKSGKRKSIRVTLKKKMISVHKIIWELFNGPIPENFIIDHIDRNPFNNKLINLELKTIRENNHNLSKSLRNTSGVTGVGWHKTKGEITHSYAHWRDENGLKKSKYFLIRKYGEDEAWRLAVEFRREMISKLNSLGYKYTETHGI